MHLLLADVAKTVFYALHLDYCNCDAYDIDISDILLQHLQAVENTGMPGDWHLNVQPHRTFFSSSYIGYLYTSEWIHACCPNWRGS